MKILKTLTVILLCGIATARGRAATIHNPTRSVTAGGSDVTTETFSATEPGSTSLNAQVGRQFDDYPIDSRGGFEVSASQQSTITANGVDFTGQASGSYHAHLAYVWGYGVSLLNVDFELLVPTSYTLTMSFESSLEQSSSDGWGTGIVRWGDLFAIGYNEMQGTQHFEGVLQPGTYHLIAKLEDSGQVDARRGPPSSAGSREKLQLSLVLTDAPVPVPDTGSCAMLLPMGLLMLCGRRYCVKTT